MQETPMPPIADELAAVAASAENRARTADELADIERELAADPWHLVRRACQAADYEFGAAASPETNGQ